MVHYALGDRLVRALTLASRAFFDDAPEGFSDVPLGHRVPVLVHARDDEREALDRLDAEISLFAELERLDAAGVHALCPLLKDDARHGIADLGAMRLDPHALLQGNLRQLKRAGGELTASCRRRTGATPIPLARFWTKSTARFTTTCARSRPHPCSSPTSCRATTAFSSSPASMRRTASATAPS